MPIRQSRQQWRSRVWIAEHPPSDEVIEHRARLSRLEAEDAMGSGGPIVSRIPSGFHLVGAEFSEDDPHQIDEVIERELGDLESLLNPGGTTLVEEEKDDYTLLCEIQDLREQQQRILATAKTERHAQWSCRRALDQIEATIAEKAERITSEEIKFDLQEVLQAA